MKKKIVAALLIAMTVGILSGCGDGAEPSSPVSGLDPQPIATQQPGDNSPEESSPGQESSQDPEGEDLGNGFLSGGEHHAIGNRVEVDGKMQSWLTGEWKDADIVRRRNMAVMMPNNKRAGYKSSNPLLKLYGISNASVIYEAPAGASITRLMPLFEDYDDLEYIGPIRSSRDYYLQEAMAFDSIYVNWGLARPWVEEMINSVYVDNISTPLAGIYNGYGDAFKRNKELNPGAATEFTGYMYIAPYTKGVKKFNYETEYRNSFVKAFEFADDGYLATYDSCPDVKMIYPGGTQSNSGGYGSNNPWFEYNEEDRLYYRGQWGSAQVDALNGEQLAVTNVILKVCEGYLKEPPKTDYLGFETDGSGKAYIFTNGKLIEGTWKRDGAIDPQNLGIYFNPNPTLYYDENGNEIVLNQGKTWICCIWDEYAKYMSWE